MKATKFLALAAVAIMATSCSNNDKEFTYNTQPGVTVEMGEATVEVKENVGLFTLPVVVTGDRNGYVTVTVECTETSSDPAIANRHYILTSDRINIAADSNEGEIEFRSVDGRGANPDLQYNVTIISVEGATIGANKTTTVTIIDKGSSPLFNELGGNYIYIGTAYEPNQELGQWVPADVVYEVTLQPGTPDGNGGGPVNVRGVGGGLNMELYYNYDAEEKYGELEFRYGKEPMGPSGPYEFLWTDANGTYQNVAPVVGAWNADFTSASFGNDNTRFIVGAFENGQYKGIYSMFGAFTLMRAN